MRQSEIVMRNRYLCLVLLVFSAVYALAQPVTITPPSATIQPGGSVTLTASGATYYQWSPATGLSTTVGPVTVASPTVTTTYTCEGFAPGAESVVNGDFEQGNVGFTSAYEYNTNLFGEGTYYVDSDASLHHQSFSGYGHNGGNFMIVNGATSPGTNVWTEQISVVPYTNYAFSTWACNVSVGNPDQVALLQFSINGEQLGSIFSAPNQLNTWNQFYELWYSGSSTTATITILNQNTVAGGNDFGLDDISFRELVLVGSPTCTVYVGSMSATATADDTELCEGESTTLHALPTGGSGNYSYSWTPANTLNNANIQHPVATPPVGTTTYTCHITDNSWGSSQNVSVSIVVHPTEVAHEYDTICEGDTYDFYGQMASAPSVYEHHTQTQFGCDKTIYLHLENWPTYDETTITEYICDGESYTFYGTEYFTNSDEAYTDHTIHGCDSIVRLHLTVYPPNDTTIVDASICIGQSYNFHGQLFSQDGDVAYFDTIDNHGCLKVEKLMLSVDEYQMPPVDNRYICVPHGETPYFRWDKNNMEYYADAYDEAIVPDPNGGCDFKYRLNLKFHQEFYEEVPPVIVCDDYYWPISEETYHEIGNHIITETFQHSFGNVWCDSTYVLNLTINESSTQETHYFDGECDEVTFPWFSQMLRFTKDCDTLLSGLTPDGCLYEVNLHIHNMQYTPTPVIAYAEDSYYQNGDTLAVITNTEFFSFQYDFFVEDSLGHFNGWDSCVWHSSKNSWLIEPFTLEEWPNRSYCRVYVAEHDDVPVELSCIIYNSYCEPYSITRKIYLKSSFFDIDEQDVVQPDFCVMPNPNDGQMTLFFDHFDGKVDVKVYDVTGNLIDSFVICNGLDAKSWEYDLKVHKGIYFFVANGGKGSIAKKVIVR